MDMTTSAHTEIRRLRINPLWLVIPATSIIFALGWSNLGGLKGAVIGGVCGLVWGVILAGIDKLIQRSKKLTIWLGTAVALSAGVILFTQMGGGLYETMLMLKALETTPEWIITITSGPLGEQVILYFIIFNTMMEVILVPLAILLNWQIPKRRVFVLAAALLFYLIRIWTYLYFAPQYFDFGNTAFSQQFVSDLLTRISRETIRFPIMIAEAVLFFCAALVPAATAAIKNEGGRE